MKNNYILIDLENVQPKNLNIVSDQDFKVLVFVGKNQSKISYELASAMQNLGKNAKYIKVEGSGTNALDFHIAYYMGVITQKDQGAYFHIISKDTGFDPLIKHLRDKKVLAHRVADISEIPILKPTKLIPETDRISTIIERLDSMGNAKPKKVQSLQNTIDSLFRKELNESELTKLINSLRSKKLIKVDGDKVSY